jgi:acyl-CoA thioesterase
MAITTGSTFSSLGYILCLTDQYVWFRRAVKDDGNKFYLYLLAYIDDILLMSNAPDVTMNAITKVYLSLRKFWKT